jgi:predicted metallo-beta-lactamase superfamily hydrolase
MEHGPPMQIIPLAADSMGVRSMATFVETKHLRLLIDPGAIVAERRFGLAPHPLEITCLKGCLERIALFAKSADTIVITKYDAEHFSPDRPEWARNKRLIVKNPNLHIRPAIRTFAFEFLKTVRNTASEIAFADGMSFVFGKTRLTFSESYSIDPDENAEGALPLSVEEDEDVFLYSSGTKGVYPDGAAAFLSSRPSMLMYLDGPLTHQTDRAGPKTPVGPLFKRIRKIITDSAAQRIILDHHLLRDPKWRQRVEPLAQVALQKRIVLQTAAEYRGEEIMDLEARRRTLYELHPHERVHPQPREGRGQSV